MTIAASPHRVRPRLDALCPSTATRPLRSWLVAICVLWAILWLQLGVVPAPWNRVLALVLFGVACGDTVIYGMTVRPRHEVGPKAPGLLSSSAVGVLALAAVSWTPFLAIGTLYSLLSRSIGPLAFILIFGVPVSLVLAISGYLLILLLLAAGRVLAWATSAPWRRRRAKRRIASS